MNETKAIAGSDRQIWVDADACPNPIKEILFRAAKRLGIQTTFVANQELQIGCGSFEVTIYYRNTGVSVNNLV